MRCRLKSNGTYEIRFGDQFFEFAGQGKLEIDSEYPSYYNFLFPWFEKWLNSHIRAWTWDYQQASLIVDQEEDAILIMVTWGGQ